MVQKDRVLEDLLSMCIALVPTSGLHNWNMVLQTSNPRTEIEVVES